MKPLDLPYCALGNRTPSEVNGELAEKTARFKSVVFPYPPHVALHDRCDYMQQLGVLTRGRPQMGLRVLALTGSGKSTAAEAYMDLVERRRPKTETFIPILKVDLDKGATPKKLMMSILDEFGDPYAPYGNELMLKKRVFACFERFGTELLIVDEVQHLNYRNGIKNDVTDTLKGMLDAGVVPILFLGTEEAEGMFRRNLQLNGRLLPPLHLHPLSAESHSDRALFAGFVARSERVVVDQGILPECSSFSEAGLLPGLFEVSAGVVGRVSRLFQIALEPAIRRGAARLEPSDMAWAVDKWAVEQDFAKTNPFREFLNA